MSPTLGCVVAAVLLSAMPDGAVALYCVKCSNLEGVLSCDDIVVDYVDEFVHELCENVEGMKTVCFRELTSICQSYTYKNAEAQTGYGGGRLKIWKSVGCAHVNETDLKYSKHKQCYWERIRNGRDIEHKQSGLKVVARSKIKVTSFCDEHLCNVDDAEDACGPSCHQASRDECETPGYEPEADGATEPFSSDCRCPEEIEPLTKDDARHWPDCGSDPNLWEPGAVGQETHRSMDGGAVGARRAGDCTTALAVLVIAVIGMSC